MKTIRYILFALLFLLAAGSTGRAQYSVRINTITIPPLNPDFDQLFGASVGGHFMVTLSSAIATGPPPPFTITLNPNFQPGAPIPVSGPAPTILTPTQLAEAFGNFIPNNLVAQGISLNQLVNAGNGLHLVLPEGTYRLCITAYLYDASGYGKP